MNPGVEKTKAHSEHLRADYRVAFRDWALQVDRLRDLPAFGVEGSVANEAKRRVKAAEVVYRDSRNRLTDNMNRPCDHGSTLTFLRHLRFLKALRISVIY
jgi:hypothetical protein